MANDLTQNIVDNATGPQAVSTDGTSVTGQSVAGQILADQYVGLKGSMKNLSRGLRFSKIIQGGQVSGVQGGGGFDKL